MFDYSHYQTLTLDSALSEIFSSANWNSLIGTKSSAEDCTNSRKVVSSILIERFISEGYCTVTDGTVRTRAELCLSLSSKIRLLTKLGYPATFVLLCDETWLLIDDIRRFMNFNFSSNSCSMDILAWCIDPCLRESGFSPHRDRQPDDISSSFRSDGLPKYITCWISFTGFNN